MDMSDPPYLLGYRLYFTRRCITVGYDGAHVAWTGDGTVSHISAYVFLR